MGLKLGQKLNFQPFFRFLQRFWSRQSFLVATQSPGRDIGFLVATQFPGRDQNF